MKRTNIIIGLVTFLFLLSGTVVFFKFFTPKQEIVESHPRLPGAPMPIPHAVDGRRRCISCHVSIMSHPDAHAPHPERENCMQCHVPKQTTGLFERP